MQKVAYVVLVFFGYGVSAINIYRNDYNGETCRAHRCKKSTTKAQVSPFVMALTYGPAQKINLGEPYHSGGHTNWTLDSSKLTMQG